MQRSTLILLVKIIVGLILLAGVFYQVDLHTVAAILGQASPAILLLSCLLLASAVICNAARWNYIMQRLDRPIEVKTAAVGYFEAMCFNQILPTGVGGDIVRVLRAHSAGVIWGWAIIGVIIDRAFGLFAAAILLLFAGYGVGSAITASQTFQVCAIFSALVVAGGLATIILGRILKADWLPHKLNSIVVLIQSFSRCATDRAITPKIAAAQFASSLLTIASFAACAYALQVPLRFNDAAIILQGITLAALIPISIGGWGIREGIVVLLFANTGVNDAAAVSTSIAFGLVLTAVGILGALIWFADGYQQYGGIKGLSAAKARSKNADIQTL
ncbi:MAG: lysylphosphatidylglycerol synthase transmembrane domain-containing protein [Beijerinckiaceae bacterium]